MSTTVHHPEPEAIGQTQELLSGNPYNSRRPTRLDPVACDCCGKPAGYFEVSRYEREFPFGSLKWVVCRACGAEGGPADSEAVTLLMIVERAGRFGEQWQDAVRSMLGWRA